MKHRNQYKIIIKMPIKKFEKFKHFSKCFNITIVYK